MKIMAFLVAMMFSVAVCAASAIEGVWRTIDDETGEAKSLVQIYPYQGKMFGRVIKLFKDVDRTAVNVAGDPKIVGLDILWNLQDEGERWENGKILDPKKGKVYNAEAWREGDKLIVRGKIAFFGRNQTWLKDDSMKPVANPVPQIPLMK